MLRWTYWVAASTAIRLASSPLTPPPTPSATIMRKASRSLSRVTPSMVGRLVWRTTICRFREQMRKWSWLSFRTFPVMGDAVDVDLVVVRLALGSGDGGGGHGDSESAGGGLIAPDRPWAKGAAAEARITRKL